MIANEADLWYRFMSEYCKMTEKLWTEKLPKYKVFPNQHHVLCIPSELHSNVNVDDKLAWFYTTFVCGDLKDGWVSDAYKDLYAFEEDTDEGIASLIKKSLSEGDYKDRNILDLIDMTEVEPEPGQTNHWRELFKEIYVWLLLISLASNGSDNSFLTSQKRNNLCTCKLKNDDRTIPKTDKFLFNRGL